MQHERRVINVNETSAVIFTANTRTASKITHTVTANIARQGEVCQPL